MRDTISRINDGTSQRLLHLIGSPTSGEGENSLYGNIQSGDIKRFKKDFRRIFSVFGSIQWRFGEEKVVVFRFTAQVLEDGLFPVPLHPVPVVDLTVSDRVVDGVGLLVSKGFVSNVKVQILNTCASKE